jgi:hypothetical protein
VVEALEAAGLLVWLDGHTLDADWCCSHFDCNGFWYNERYSHDDFVAMWRAMARRYASVPAVVAFGLMNDPRSACAGGASVACNATFFDASLGPQDCAEQRWAPFMAAMEEAGLAALSEKPGLLISVSGLDFASDLSEAHVPGRLPRESLVYEAHDYHWYELGSDYEEYACIRDNKWGYLPREGIHPVVVTEFGFPHHHLRLSEDDYLAEWLTRFSEYAQQGPVQGGVDWFYWQLSGHNTGGTGRREGSTETYGILNHCWTGPASSAHFAAIQRLQVDINTSTTRTTTSNTSNTSITRTTCKKTESGWGYGKNVTLAGLVVAAWLCFVFSIAFVVAFARGAISCTRPLQSTAPPGKTDATQPTGLILVPASSSGSSHEFNRQDSTGSLSHSVLV